MHIRNRQRGFTLIEIMVVVVILGVLAALVVPQIMNRPDQAKVTAARSGIKAIAMALDMVRGGLGLTVVPRLCLGDGDGLARVPVVAPAVSRTLVLARREDAPLEPAQRLLADAITSRVRQLLARSS